MKHIEQIQPEVAAGELSGLLLADATATAALTRLLHDWTGCDIPQTDTTPQSEVEELVPLAVSILRRHWTTPLTALGDGTMPMSLADLMRRLIGDRVQGNESLSIQPANANIPTAVSALLERKIGGVPEAPDGVSLPHLLCDSSIADTITELIDDNIGWTANKLLNTTAKKVVLGCSKIEYTNNAGWTVGMVNITEFEAPYLVEMINHNGWYDGFGFVGLGCERIYLPNFEQYSCDHYGRVFANCESLKYIDLPKFRKMSFAYGHAFALNCPELLEVNVPNLQENVTGQWAGFINNCPKLQKVVVGNSTNLVFTGECPNLIHLELAQEQTKSLNLSTWSPTTVLSERLPEFLLNFRQYIADRLSDNGSGKTLTLSQEVRDAIHSAGIDTIITNKGWTISPVPTQQ